MNAGQTWILMFFDSLYTFIHHLKRAGLRVHVYRKHNITEARRAKFDFVEKEKL